jgi:hypothetical protein
MQSMPKKTTKGVVRIACRDCSNEFDPKTTAGRQYGYVNQCNDCADPEKEVERLGGNMIWEHKTAPTLEIKPMCKALSFANNQKRIGAGVLANICT